MSNQLKIEAALEARDINAYSEQGAKRKNSFHLAGKRFLRNLANVLELVPKTYDIRSNKGGIAVSGEVILHSEHIYVQLYESCTQSGGISVMYRTCNGRRDYSGGHNFNTSINYLGDEALEAKFISHLKELIKYGSQRGAPPPAIISVTRT